MSDVGDGRRERRWVMDGRKWQSSGVDPYAKMVDDDWHDGWEEQSEEVVEYACDLQPVWKAVLQVATSGAASGAAFARCNDVMVGMIVYLHITRCTGTT